MTVEDRARTIAELIESTPAAVELRSEALELLVGGNAGAAIIASWNAAEAVMAAHPAILRDVTPGAFRRYLWTSVLGLASGRLAELDLLPPTN